MSENNLKEIWNLAINQIEQEYRETGRENEFKLWFNMSYIEDNISTIKVSVPSSFMWQTMISRGNIEIVKNQIKKITGQTVDIEGIVQENQIYEEKKDIPQQEIKKESKIEKTFQNNFEEKKSVVSKNSTLNPNYTFENFIAREGSSNDFAYKVSMAVANNPGEKSNPVLIYGGVGLGKTHLMQSIGNKINEDSNGTKKICYIQAESFTSEFTKSIQNQSMNNFIKKYRHLDVLLIDDIQFLQGKTSTQEELFYTFEELHKKHAQMIFACDRPLSEIENMADRLVSRLGSGMCLNLEIPDFENRKAILYKKLENKNTNLDDPIIDLIAQTVETNVRDLEAALTRILAYKEFINPNVTLEIARSQLSEWEKSPDIGNISITNIQKVVADNYDITVADLKSKNRSKKYSLPRFIAIYIGKEMTDYTYSELGYEFGGKDHSTIMHAYNDIEEKIKIDPSLKNKVKYLMDEVRKYKN